ncbi:MAG: hypothetical protein RL220_708 [Bacteroidota bacterium]
MKLQEIIRALEEFAPLSLQESYDNSGLLFGDPAQELRGALVSLDCTEAVVEEAIDKKCDLIIAHHPLIFSGLKKITPARNVDRALIKAIRHNIALYAIHTNLDNVRHGVNAKISERLRLSGTRILAPRSGDLSKLVVFVPVSHAESVRQAMFRAGAGEIGQYAECSFSNEGTGTFKAGQGTNPFVGQQDVRHEEPEIRLEVVVPVWRRAMVVSAMTDAHPYEEVAYDLFPMLNQWSGAGSGMIGNLQNPMPWQDFFEMLKERMKVKVIRHTQPVRPAIEKVAVCGGSGSFLISAAKSAGADVFITADMKYHQFFDAENSLMIADIGHFESEQFTPELIIEELGRKFPTFATHFSAVHTNPVQYFY